MLLSLILFQNIRNKIDDVVETHGGSLKISGGSISLILQTEHVLYLELLDAGHVVVEHAVLQQGDGVTLPADLLDLLTCAVAERGEIRAGMH